MATNEQKAAIRHRSRVVFAVIFSILGVALVGLAVYSVVRLLA